MANILYRPQYISLTASMRIKETYMRVKETYDAFLRSDSW